MTNPERFTKVWVCNSVTITPLLVVADVAVVVWWASSNWKIGEMLTTSPCVPGTHSLPFIWPTLMILHRLPIINTSACFHKAALLEVGCCGRCMK